LRRYNQGNGKRVRGRATTSGDKVGLCRLTPSYPESGDKIGLCRLTASKPALKLESAYGSLRMKLQYDETLSNFAFNFNLRRYMEANAVTAAAAAAAVVANNAVAKPKPSAPRAAPAPAGVDGTVRKRREADVGPASGAELAGFLKRWAERTNGGATSSSSEVDLVRHTAAMLGSLQVQRNNTRGGVWQIFPSTSTTLFPSTSTFIQLYGTL